MKIYVCEVTHKAGMHAHPSYDISLTRTIQLTFLLYLLFVNHLLNLLPIEPLGKKSVKFQGNIIGFIFKKEH